MKKNLLWIGMSMIIVMSLASFINAPKDVDPTGTWTFSVPDAPYDYQSGEIVFAKVKKAYKIKIIFNEYFKIDATNVKYEKNTLSFRANIDNETIYIKGTFDKKTGFKGKAMTSMGDMPMTAKRKVKKKTQKK